MEMTQKESNQLNESFKDLDGIQSDEIEKKVPVQIETEKIIDGFDEDLLSCLNSDIKENRIKLVEDNEREEEVENLNIPKPEALPEVRPNSIPEKELLPMTKSTQISYHRENMMKEVNEMIGELQVILKPKTEETFESSISEPPKVLSKSSDSPVKKSIIKEWIKDLLKTEFWSESVGLSDFKENYEADLISMENYNEEIEAKFGNIDSGTFKWSTITKDPLYL